MKGNRIESLENALGFLVDRMAGNVNKVKLNSVLARDMVSSDTYSKKVEEIRNENRNLLDENKQLLNLQLSLRKYLSVYKDAIINDQEQINAIERTVNEWFELTIKGEVELNENHPMINNEDFLNDLLHFYKDCEEYEKCDKVLKMINSIGKVC